MKQLYKKSLPPVLIFPSNWDDAVRFMDRRQSGRIPCSLKYAIALTKDCGHGLVRRANRWARKVSEYLETEWLPIDCDREYLLKLQIELEKWAAFHIGHPRTIDAIRNQALPKLREYIAASGADYLSDLDGAPLMKNFAVRFIPGETIITFSHPRLGRFDRNTSSWYIRIFFEAARRNHWQVTGEQLRDFMGKRNNGKRDLVSSWPRAFERAKLQDIWDMLVRVEGKGRATRYILRILPAA